MARKRGRRPLRGWRRLGRSDVLLPQAVLHQQGSHPTASRLRKAHDLEASAPWEPTSGQQNWVLLSSALVGHSNHTSLCLLGTSQPGRTPNQIDSPVLAPGDPISLPHPVRVRGCVCVIISLDIRTELWSGGWGMQGWSLPGFAGDRATAQQPGQRAPGLAPRGREPHASESPSWKLSKVSPSA